MTDKPVLTKSLKQQRLEARVAKRANKAKKITTKNIAHHVHATGAQEEAATMEILNGDKDLPIWHGIDQLRADCWELYGSPASQCHNILENPVLKVSSRYNDVLTLMRQMETDLQRSKEQLEAIGGLHSGRSGAASNPDDHFEAMSIGFEYQNWLSNFTSVIMPIVGDIVTIAASVADEAQAVEIAEKVEG